MSHLEWIPSLDFSKAQRDNSEQRLPGTGEWFFEAEEFKKWDEEPTSPPPTEARVRSLPAEQTNILCVEGNSGCGKSCLASLLISRYEDPEDDQQSSDGSSDDSSVTSSEASIPALPPTTALVYLYCNSRNRDMCEPERLLASILSQLYFSTAVDYVNKQIKKKFKDKRKGFQLGLADMLDPIIELLQQFEKVHIIVDGLDECRANAKFDDFCKTIRKIGEIGSSTTRLAIFHRPNYTSIHENFAGFPHLLLNTASTGHEEDIKTYISSIVEKEQFIIRSNQDLLTLVKEELRRKADGMFLWVRLVAKTLAKIIDPETMKKQLKELPEGLYDAYHQAMDRISRDPNKDRLFQVLMWVANAMVPITREQLRVALAIRPDSTDIDPDRLITDEGLTTYCGDLVVLQNGNYVLLHTSVQEYLTQPSIKNGVKDEDYQKLQSAAHFNIATACVTYLMFQKFRSGPFRLPEDAGDFLKENPFWKYAAMSTGYHIREESQEKFVDSMLQLSVEEPVRDRIMQYWHHHHLAYCDDVTYPFPKPTKPLHLLSLFRLEGIAKNLPGVDEQVHMMTGTGFYPLDYAMNIGSEVKETCLWLLDQYPQLDAGMWNYGGSVPLLHVAGVRDLDDIVRKLLSRGYDVSNIYDGGTALHFAASAGSNKAVRALLSLGADIDFKDHIGDSPLLAAANSNHVETARILLDAGADVDSRSEEGWTALHFAAREGNVPITKMLVEDFNATIDAQSYAGGITPLYTSAEANEPEVLEYLLRKGAEPDKHGSSGWTALLVVSAKTGNTRCFNSLVGAGADISGSTALGDNAAHLAGEAGYRDILKIIAEKRPELLEAENVDGETALHVAIRNSETWIALFLLSKCPALAKKANQEGTSPLHLAMTKNLGELIEALIKEYKVEINIPGIWASSPVHYAATDGLSQYIPLLLEHGADVNFLNKDNQTPLHFAMRSGQLDFAMELINQALARASQKPLSINPEGVDISLADNWGNTALHLAAINGYPDAVEYLLSKGSSLHHKNINSSSVIHRSAASGHTECIRIMAKEPSFDVDVRGEFGRTALIMAAESGHLETTKYLLELGAQVNLYDTEDWGPLAFALRTGKTDLIDLLLENGADPTKVNSSGWTNLHTAAELNLKPYVELFLSKGANACDVDELGNTAFSSAVIANSIEIVTLFLDHGMNGCNIRTSFNTSVYHSSAENGNLPMFRKLLEAGRAIDADYTTPDKFGRSPLVMAAYEGRVNMIPTLLSLGFSPNAPESEHTPLGRATRGGHVEFVKALINNNQEVDVDVDSFGTSELPAVIVAATQGFREIFDLLMASDADLNLRDKYGRSAVDYARERPLVWSKEEIAELELKLRPWTKAQEAEAVRGEVVRLTNKLLDYTEPDQLGRLNDLMQLAHTCCRSSHPDAVQDATICYKEICNYSKRTDIKIDLECAICGDIKMGKTMYMCKFCVWDDLCHICYEEWEKEGTTPAKSPPKMGTELEELEATVRPLRIVAEEYLPFGLEMVLPSFEYVCRVSQFITETMAKKYIDWETKYDKDNRFTAARTPGRQFLENLIMGRNIIVGTKENLPFLPSGDHPKLLSEVTKKLEDLNKAYPPKKILTKFQCTGHQRFPVPVNVKWEKEDKLNGIFNDEGLISNEWITELRDKYTQLNPSDQESPRIPIISRAGTIPKSLVEDGSVDDPVDDLSEHLGTDLLLKESMGFATSLAALASVSKAQFSDLADSMQSQLRESLDTAVNIALPPSRATTFDVLTQLPPPASETADLTQAEITEQLNQDSLTGELERITSERVTAEERLLLRIKKELRIWLAECTWRPYLAYESITAVSVALSPEQAVSKEKNYNALIYNMSLANCSYDAAQAVLLGKTGLKLFEGLLRDMLYEELLQGHLSHLL